MADKIKITCRGADSLPLDAIEEFQGNLKKRSKKDIELIIKSIEKYGFSFPFFVWNGSGHNYCLDGHGRIQALCEMRKRGVSLPLFPVDYIEAEDEAEAKQKLLRLNSQYGQMSVDSVLEFASDIELDWGDLELPSGTLMYKSEEYGNDAEEDDIGDPDPRIIVTLSFSGAVWLSKRSEILDTVEKLKRKYECTAKVKERKSGILLSGVMILAMALHYAYQNLMDMRFLEYHPKQLNWSMFFCFLFSGGNISTLWHSFCGKQGY